MNPANPSEKSSLSYVLLALVAVLVIVLAGLGYFAYSKGLLKFGKTASNQPSKTSTSAGKNTGPKEFTPNFHPENETSSFVREYDVTYFLEGKVIQIVKNPDGTHDISLASTEQQSTQVMTYTLKKVKENVLVRGINASNRQAITDAKFTIDDVKEGSKVVAGVSFSSSSLPTNPRITEIDLLK